VGRALLVANPDQLDLRPDERVEERDGGAAGKPKMISTPSRSRHCTTFSPPVGIFAAWLASAALPRSCAFWRDFVFFFAAVFAIFAFFPNRSSVLGHHLVQT